MTGSRVPSAAEITAETTAGITGGITAEIAAMCGASSVRSRDRIQSVWSGFGELVRCDLVGCDRQSVVVKHVRPPKGSGRSHERKLRSYDIEQHWYQTYGPRCSAACRIADCLGVRRARGEWLFVLEDLDAAGFDRRGDRTSGARLDACLRWLAAFHAEFLGQKPTGLWKTGTYWHLKTRPDELAAMDNGPLRAAAATIDQKLSAAKWLTLVHGDAKPANFCFNRRGDKVAAVDFQYVGGGVGIKDVVYLLSGTDLATKNRALHTYFQALSTALNDPARAAAVEAEWRPLVPWAWADFHRFIAGWAPGWNVHPQEATWTNAVLANLQRQIGCDS